MVELESEKDDKLAHKFHMKAWDESIRHQDLLEIIDTERKYLGFGPMREQAYKTVFATIPDPIQDMVIIENPNGKIIGFVSLHQSNFSKTLVIWDAMLPEYFQTTLPELIIQQAISLGKRRNLPNLKYSTVGSLCKPIDDALEKLGIIPQQIALELHLSDFEGYKKNFSTPIALEGITFSKTNVIKDYEQFAFVCNEAFRDNFDYKELTVEGVKKGEIHNRARGELEYDFAFRNSIGKEDENDKNNTLIGFCEIIYDNTDSSGRINRLAVLPNVQHLGIGKTLITIAIQRFQQKGYMKGKINVWVNDENKAETKHKLNFFTQFGFKTQVDYTTRVYNLLSGKS